MSLCHCTTNAWNPLLRALNVEGSCRATCWGWTRICIGHLVYFFSVLIFLYSIIFLLMPLRRANTFNYMPCIKWQLKWDNWRVYKTISSFKIWKWPFTRTVYPRRTTSSVKRLLSLSMNEDIFFVHRYVEWNT